MRLGSTFVCTICLFAFAHVGRASGQEETAQERPPETQVAAQEHFRQGQEAYDETRYSDAVREFQQAYDLSGRAELLYNIGIAHERLLDWGATIDAFESYLRLLPDAPNHDNVQARLELAWERLTASENSSATAPPSAPAVSAGETSSASASHAGQSHAGPIAFLVAGGVVALGGGVLVGLGASTLGDVESTPPETRQWSDAEQDVARGNTLRTSGVIALSVGVVALTAGLIWLLSK